MPIGFDAVGQMLETFDKVIGAKAAPPLPKKSWDIKEIGDIPFFGNTPEGKRKLSVFQNTPVGKKLLSGEIPPPPKDMELATYLDQYILPKKGATPDPWKMYPPETPVEKNRVARGKAAGFDEPVYHGTRRDFDAPAFRNPPDGQIGVHGGTRRAAHDIQGKYSGTFDPIPSTASDSGARPRVYPLRTAIKNPLRLPDLGSWPPNRVGPAMVNTGKFTQAEVDKAMAEWRKHPTDKTAVMASEKLRDLIHKKGFDGIIYKNMVEDPGSDSYIFTDMTKLRSQYAQFDTKKKGSEHMLASLAAGGIGVPMTAGMFGGDGEAKAEGAEQPPQDLERQNPQQNQQPQPLQDPAAPASPPGQLPKDIAAAPQPEGWELPHAPHDMLAKISKTLYERPKTGNVEVAPDDPFSRVKELFKGGADDAVRGIQQLWGNKPDELPPWVRTVIGGETPGREESNKQLYTKLAGTANLVSGLAEMVTSPLGLVSKAAADIPVPTGKGTAHLPEAATEMMLSMVSPSGWLKMSGMAQKANTMIGPGKEIIRATSDDLYKLRNWVTADKAELSQHLDKMPAEFKTAAAQEKFYLKLERPETVLTPQEQEAFDTWIEPMRREIQKLSQVAGKYGMPLQDNEWVHRVMKGKEGELPVDAAGAADIPQLGTRKLPRKTSAMMPRSLYVLEAEDGRRAVVSQPKPGLLTVWNKGKGQTVKWGDDLELGNPLIISGQKYVVKHAKTSELELDTPYRFQKSAAVNMGDALVKMRATVRNIQYLDRLTNSADWRLWATKKVGAAPRDWITPQIPQLKDWKVHPKLAGPLDDFYSPNIEANGVLEPLRNVNRWAVGTLFWNPIPHIENVAGHWYVGRGWDWLKPTGWHSLFSDGARAIKETITMGNDYKDLLKHGSALISGGVQNADFYRVLAKKFQLEVERNPGKWEAMARKMGMGSPIDLARAWYGGVNRVLWQANDVFMMQRVFELERRGMSRLDAIKEAEKHIPNYRVPPEVLGSRMFSKIMQDPAITAFGRYHYGVWNSYTNMVRDVVGKDASPKERAEAVGNMMALASLVFGVYPAVSWGLEQLTGDKDIQKLPRGPAAIPTALYKSMTSGERQWYDVIGQSITLAPTFKELLEQYSNRDFFTGQHIEEPGETSPARRAAQRVEHAAQTMVSPYNQGMQAKKQLDEKGVPRMILDQVIGAQDRTQQQIKGQQRGKKMDRAYAKSRRRKPKGLIEEYGGAME